MTCTIKQDTGTGFGPAPDNTKCDYTITGANAATSFCTTSGGTGTCTFSDSGAATGTDTIHASTTFSILGHSTTRSTLTSGTDSSGDGLDVINTWNPPPGP
jgi:hypothetical protein